MINRSASAYLTSAFICVKLLITISVVLAPMLTMIDHAAASGITGTPLEQIEGFKTTKQIASPHTFFVSFGPKFPENELKRQNKKLPQWVVGASYRIAFIGQDKYVDLVVELIASGEEGSPKRIINSYWLSGSDIEGTIGTQNFNTVTLTKWTDYRTLLLVGGSIGNSPSEDVKKAFKLTILDNGEFDIDPIPQRVQ